MASFQERLVGAWGVRAETFEDVEHDTRATGQAAAVVATSALAGGVVNASVGDVLALPLALVFVLFSWFVGAWLVLKVGTTVLPGQNTESNLGEMLRTTGFAQAPGIFGIVAAVPAVGGALGVVVSVWTFAALVVGIRQALDYDRTWKAVLVCLIAWLLIFGAAALAGLAVSRV